MTYPIEVRQFEFGNQGYYQYRETVRREVHDSSCYSPVGNGCCSETIAKRTYQWVEYKGKKYVVTPDTPARCEAWNDWTDALMKNKEITPAQYESWDNPF